jgi:RNA polymerase sigma factor (sigma-70 family)
MVLDVCRGVLGNEADAEDAFQATFLVLACKAGSIRRRESVASWLHGVAYRTALKARTQGAIRHKHEARLPAPAAATADDLTWREVRQALHEELGRLAERYRAPLVLCYLEGARQEEAATALGLAKSTLKERLERGRALLRARLLARGLGPTALLILASWPGAKVTAALASSTLQAATLFAAEPAAAAGVVAPKVAALTQGVLTTMLLSKFKNALAVLFVIILVTLSGSALISGSQATEPAGKRDDVQKRVAELRQQLQQIQKKLAHLEQGGPRHDPREPRDALLAKRFPHRIAFEIGWSETREGGRLDIQEVWGTRPQIEVGGQYLVRGKYKLPAGERGKLYFYETATGDWSQTTTTLDLQMATADPPQGEFTLVHGMVGPGYFHLVLADPERYSQPFANVYFGTGDNVLRKRP